MKEHPSNQGLKVRLMIIGVAFLTAVGGFFFADRIEARRNLETSGTPPKRQKTKPAKTAPNDAKYAKFSHQSHSEKLKLACDSCHKVPTANWKTVRPKDEAFEDVTDYPQHQSCISCHREQFFSGKTPAICSICHTNPSPQDSTRHPFGNPRSLFDVSPKGKQAVSQFEIGFPHDKHIDIVSRFENDFQPIQKGALFVKAGRRMAEESCGVCHQTRDPQGNGDDEYFSKPPKDLGDGFWLKKGTFKTSPTDHAKCFSCHSAESGILPAPTDCGTCHKPKQANGAADFDFKLAEKIGATEKSLLLAWRKRDSSGTFRHEWFSHAELACATCHNAGALNTLDAVSKKVKILSCGGDGTGCHITPTSDDGGILNAEIDFRKKDAKFDCVKCHLSYGKSQIPESHLKAVAEILKK